MEKTKILFCAWVNGNEEDLNRTALKEEFSKFGKVVKVFIDSDVTYAKVYLDDIQQLKLACDQLNGFKSWKIKFYKDDFKGRSAIPQGHNQGFNNYDSAISKSRSPLNQSLCGSSNDNEENMDEECMYAGDYVDVHGRPIEVLQGENGVMYVNLDDIRAAGYNIYKKESFENATITKDIELRALENYLLNQARKYCIESKKNFNEDEVLGVFERVKAKLQNKSVGEFGEGRLVKTSPNTKNFTITKSNGESPAASHHHTKTKPKGQHSRSDVRQDRQNGIKNAGFRRSYDKQENKNEDRKKPVENNVGVTQVAQIPSNTRKPRQNVENLEIQKTTRSKALAYNDANEEPEENWEGAKTTVPKSKPQKDSVPNERGHISIERIVLAPAGIHRVKVSYVPPDKKSVFYGQSVDNLNQIEEILLHVNTKDVSLPNIAAPARDMLCIASFEDCWYRAVVINEKQNGGCYVELIDYGNKENIRTPLKEMSRAMKKLPAMAIRMTVNIDQDSENLKICMDQEMELYVKKQIRKEYDDLTHLVSIKRIFDKPNLDQELPTTPSDTSSDSEPPQTTKVAADVPEDCFMEVPSSTVGLTKGESVMIVSYTDTKFILRNRETAMKCKELYTHMDKLQKKPIANPKVGQLVLCSKDGSENLHRAVIKKINNQVAELEYLDHYGGVTLSLTSLRHIDKISAAYPVTKLESPDVEWLRTVTDKSEDFIFDIILKKTKLRVVLDGSSFDLLVSDGGKDILLSKKISELESGQIKEHKEPEALAEPSKHKEPPKALPTPKKDTPIMATVAEDDKFVKIDYNEMPFAKAKMGENEYICYNCKDGSMTLLSTSDAAQYMESLLVAEPTDTVPFQPDECDMCLCKFDEVWYRAVLLEIQKETCQVMFVDFGNTEFIPKTDIRKFPKEFAKIPILGINAYLMGIPDTPKVQQRLTELVPDETELNVTVKTEIDENLKYGIEIPSIYAVLREEKLI